jgi:prepilin-type N-terminal cleavage/methylation domain-containing protein
MTSALRSARAGFSLVEILVVLAIIALVGTLLVPGVNAVLRSLSDEAPDRLVWGAVTAARARALETSRTVWMRFDAKSRKLSWDDGVAAGERELPAGTSMQFLQPQPAGMILLGGTLVESQEMPAVRFHPDGTCDHFRVQLRSGTAAPTVFAVDPWTCAPILRTVK